jgi:HK97 family phage portal protein
VAARAINWAANDPYARGQLHDALAHAFGIALGDRHPRTIQQMLVNTSWVFAANRQIAGRGARVKPVLEFCTRERNKPVKRTPAHEHPWLDLVASPNVDESGMTFLWRQILLLNTAGSYVVAVEPQVIDFTPLGINFKTTRIAGLRLLEIERTRVYSSERRLVAGFNYTSPLGWVKFYPAHPATYEEREGWKRNPTPFAFRVVMPSPDSYDGQSVTQAAEQAINTSQGINQLHQNKLYNGMHNDLIFFLKKKGMDDIKRFEEAVLKIKAGIGKAGDPIVLPEELVTVAPNPTKMSDMQFPKMAEAARHEILAVMGASDGMLGLVADVNRANGDALERLLAMGTIDPILALIADGYNNALLPLYAAQSTHSWYEARFPSALVQDETVQATNLKMLVGGTIMTPNEAREKINLPAVADGTDLVGGNRSEPLALIAAAAGTTDTLAEMTMPKGDAGSVDPVDAGDEPTDQGNDAPDRARAAALPEHAAMFPLTIDIGSGGDVLVGKEIATKHDAAPAADTAGTAPRTASLRAGHRLSTSDARHARWADDMETHAGYARQLRARVAKVFRAWQSDVQSVLETGGAAILMADLRRGTARAAGDDDTQHRLQDIAVWIAALRTEYRPWARALVLDQIERTFDDLGIDASQLDADDPAVDRWVEMRADAFAAQVATTQQQAIVDGMTDSLADNLDSDDISDAADDWFPNANSGRARRIGTTETTIGAGAGVFLGVAAARRTLSDPNVDAAALTGDAADVTDDFGSGASDHVGLMWLSQRDNRVRETHVEADGQVVVAGDVFTVGGYQMNFPGDDSLGAGPEEICECRCDAVAVPLDLSDDPADTSDGKEAEAE